MTYFRSILSVWIVFHLFAIALYPARGFSYLSYRMLCWTMPYSTSLEFHHTWNFFNYTEFGQVYLDYSYRTRPLSGQVETGVFPSSDEQPLFHFEQWNSSFPLVNVLNEYPSELRAEALGRFLCQKHPTAIDFKMNLRLVPPIPLRANGDVSSFIKKVVRPRESELKWTYSCQPSNA